MRWPKYWSFSFSISPSKEYPGLISFRMDWLDLLAVQGTLKGLLQHHVVRTKKGGVGLLESGGDSVNCQALGMEENVSADDGNMAVFSSSNKEPVIVNRPRQGLVSQAESVRNVHDGLSGTNDAERLKLLHHPGFPVHLASLD